MLPLHRLQSASPPGESALLRFRKCYGCEAERSVLMPSFDSVEELLVVVDGTDVLVDERGPEPSLPRLSELQGWGPTSRQLRDRDGHFLAARGDKADAGLPAGFAFRPVRSLLSSFPEEQLDRVGRALAIFEFEETHQHCGRCGQLTVPGPAAEISRICAACQLSFYPRIPPALIVLIEKGEAILLARSPRFPPGRFGAVAGFVELGETLEEAVRREVAEEVGLQVEDVRYFGSQPWPFGRSLMIGFRARYAGGDIHVDGQEICEAGWFTADALPQLPPPLSMARKLIEAFLRERAAGEVDRAR